MPPQGRRLMRDDFRPTHIVERKRKKAKRMALFVFLTLLLVVGGVVYVSRIPSLKISSIEVVGNKVIDSNDVKDTVTQTLSGKYFFVFPKDNFLIYPSRELLGILETTFPRAEYINPKLEGQKLVIEMKERGGRFLWCGDVPTDKDVDEQCYFTDGRGYIFDKAPYFSDNVYLKIYGTRVSSIEEIIGSKILSEEDFKNVVNLRAILYENDMHATILYLKEDGDYEFWLSRPSNESSDRPKIFFSKKSDFSEIASNLISALENEPLKTDFKEKYSSLLYLDARFDNKVFFKFKESENAD
jgi:hypothetical protein